MKTNLKIFTPLLLIGALAFFVSNESQVEAAADDAGNKRAAWTTDYSAARQVAREQGKPLLLEFTGSDWCPPCMRMNKEVFSNEAFIDYSDENLVLVKLDFPRRKAQESALKAQNEALAQEYGVRGFPTVILLSAEGDVINTEVGFQPGGAEKYVEQLRQLVASK